MSVLDDLSWVLFGWVGIFVGWLMAQDGPSTFTGWAVLLVAVVLHLFFAIRVEMVFGRYKKLLKEKS